MVGVLNMRLTGTITVNGVRVPLDWRIYGTRIEAGTGLPCEGVKVHIDLPNLDNTSGNLVSPIEVPEFTPIPEPATPYDEMTVTDLRVILKERGLTLGGTKADLVERLIENDAAPHLEEGEENGSEE